MASTLLEPKKRHGSECNYIYLFYIPWPFPPVLGVADNIKKKMKQYVLWWRAIRIAPTYYLRVVRGD